MVNLLPPTAKKKYVVEYYVRTVTVWLFLITAALVVVGSLMIPLWVSVEIQNAAIAPAYERAFKGGASFAELEGDIIAANTLAGELNRSSQYQLLLPYIIRLQELSGSLVSIQSISMQRSEKGEVKEIMVTGVAATRVALAAYRDALEVETMFAAVELPISNLAKDLDVPFNITITTTQERS